MVHIDFKQLKVDRMNKTLMKKYNIIILSPTSINLCKYLVSSKGWQWLYMGTNACRREEILKELGVSKRHHYAKELQNISLKYKKTFLDLVADIGMRQNTKFWWSGNIAYKSPFTSDIFLNYCSLLLIQKWIAEDVKKRIIIVENPWVIKACSDNFQDQFVYIDNNSKYFLKSLILCHITSYTRITLFFFRSLLMWIVNKVYSLKYHKQITGILENKIDVLTCTWIEDRSFKGRENHFCDPYLGNLQEYYAKKGLKTIAVTMSIFPLRLLKKVYCSKEIIPSIYFAKLSDIFEIYLKTLLFSWNIKISDHSFLDFKHLFEYENIREKGSICHAFLLYRIFFNIFKQQRISCSALLYPFENQPWDKMMILGTREAKSKCKIVACHNIGVPYFYLNFFLGEKERNIHPQPDIIVSNGKYWGGVLNKSGFLCTIKNGGSIRFSSGTKCNRVNQSRNSLIKNNCDSNILVLLSTSLSYSLDLLFYLIRLSKECDKNFLIKPHPDTPKKVLKKYVGEIPDNFTFIAGSMSESMEKAGWAIHIGTTAAIECMMQGLTVFKYLPERIDLDPLLGMDITQQVVTDKDILGFTKKCNYKLPDNNLIAEPFNEEVWTEIMKN